MSISSKKAAGVECRIMFNTAYAVIAHQVVEVLLLPMLEPLFSLCVSPQLEQLVPVLQ